MLSNRIDAISKQPKQIDQFILKDIPNGTIEKIIHAEGDVQNNNTNLKCDMTSWKFHTEYEVIGVLAKFITEIINDQDPYNWILGDCWGAVYRKGNAANMHSHYPYGKSFIYYVKALDGSSPLVFDNTYYRDQVYSINPKTGMLVTFPSDCEHSVPASTSDEERTIISGNLFWVPDEFQVNTR